MRHLDDVRYARALPLLWTLSLLVAWSLAGCAHDAASANSSADSSADSSAASSEESSAASSEASSEGSTEASSNGSSETSSNQSSGSSNDSSGSSNQSGASSQASGESSQASAQSSNDSSAQTSGGSSAESSRSSSEGSQGSGEAVEPSPAAEVSAVVVTSALLLSTVAGIGFAIYGTVAGIQHQRARPDARSAALYLGAQAHQLEQDLALGAGPVLDDLSAAAGIPSAHRGRFGRLLQRHRTELLSLARRETLTPERALAFLQRVGELTWADPLLRAEARAQLQLAGAG